MSNDKIGLKALQNGSDIRGIAIPGVSGEANLLRTEAESLTQGYLRWLSEKTDKPVEELAVAVGCDSRLSGPYLKQIILVTLSVNDVTFFDCGLASTPAMFMATKFRSFQCDGAVMITASHLPYERNGFKYFDAEGGLQKADIARIIEYAEEVLPKENEGGRCPAEGKRRQSGRAPCTGRSGDAGRGPCHERKTRKDTGPGCL